eukprot:5136335-Amphidinium_carterae.1
MGGEILQLTALPYPAATSKASARTPIKPLAQMCPPPVPQTSQGKRSRDSSASYDQRAQKVPKAQWKPSAAPAAPAAPSAAQSSKDDQPDNKSTTGNELSSSEFQELPAHLAWMPYEQLIPAKFQSTADYFANLLNWIQSLTLEGHFITGSDGHYVLPIVHRGQFVVVTRWNHTRQPASWSRLPSPKVLRQGMDHNQVRFCSPATTQFADLDAVCRLGPGDDLIVGQADSGAYGQPAVPIEDLTGEPPSHPVQITVEADIVDQIKKLARKARSAAATCDSLATQLQAVLQQATGSTDVESGHPSDFLAAAVLGRSVVVLYALLQPT